MAKKTLDLLEENISSQEFFRRLNLATVDDLKAALETARNRIKTHRAGQKAMEKTMSKKLRTRFPMRKALKNVIINRETFYIESETGNPLRRLSWLYLHPTDHAFTKQLNTYLVGDRKKKKTFLPVHEDTEVIVVTRTEHEHDYC